MTVNKEISLLQKVMTCTITGLVVCCACRPNNTLMPSWMLPLIYGLGLLFFVCVFFGAFVWHFIEKKREINTLQLLAIAQDMITYSTSYFMITFGLQKILHLHITTTLFWMDMPRSMINDDQYLSSVFGQSYPLAGFIGFLQIFGGISLLFRKIRRLGIFILLPILVNIVMIDYVFGMDWFISTIAIILTIGLFYMLYLEKEDIFDFFFTDKQFLNLPIKSIKTTNFFQKVVACIITGLVATVSIALTNNKFVPNWWLFIFIPILSGLCILSAIIGIFVWHFQEKKGVVNSSQVLTYLQGVIAYSTAYFMITFGFLKIFRLHMTTALGWLDMPRNMLNGNQYMSSVFGQSYPMAIFLGCLEIIGGILLLFKKTRLMGVFTLLPILTNVVLFDFVFDVELDISIVALILTIGLFYYLYQEKERLITFFFKTKNNFPL